MYFLSLQLAAINLLAQTGGAPADDQSAAASLATVANTAPFVGLFGTVFGIINPFQSMSTNQSGGITAVAGGISEALITTAFGLFVAVPAVWFFNYFSNRIETFSVDMNN